MSVVAGIDITHPEGYRARLLCSDCGELTSPVIQPMPEPAYEQSISWMKSHQNTHAAVSQLLHQIEQKKAI